MTHEQAQAEIFAFSEDARAGAAASPCWTCEGLVVCWEAEKAGRRYLPVDCPAEETDLVI